MEGECNMSFCYMTEEEISSLSLVGGFLTAYGQTILCPPLKALAKMSSSAKEGIKEAAPHVIDYILTQDPDTLDPIAENIREAVRENIFDSIQESIDGTIESVDHAILIGEKILDEPQILWKGVKDFTLHSSIALTQKASDLQRKTEEAYKTNQLGYFLGQGHSSGTIDVATSVIGGGALGIKLFRNKNKIPSTVKGKSDYVVELYNDIKARIDKEKQIRNQIAKTKHTDPEFDELYKKLNETISPIREMKQNIKTALKQIKHQNIEVADVIPEEIAEQFGYGKKKPTSNTDQQKECPTDTDITPKCSTEKKEKKKGFGERKFSKRAAVEKSRKAQEKAERRKAKLPDSLEDKTVASDGIVTLSGWKEEDRKNYNFNNVQYQEVMDYYNTMKPKYKVDTHGRDTIRYGRGLKQTKETVPGRYFASHAERQQAVRDPNKPIGITEEMCNNCKKFFHAHANYQGVPQVVSEPDKTLIFYPGQKKPEQIKTNKPLSSIEKEVMY